MRTATDADVDAITETIARAFADDPAWGPVLTRADGGTDHRLPFWRHFAEGGIPLGATYRTDDGGAVALWIPPGADEMTEQQVESLTALVSATFPAEHADAMFALWDRFDETHPQDEPHMYLSLLATHPDHRGRGIAQQLVRENLERFDGQGLPTYLESTNPLNDARYERLGFRRTGGFAGWGDGVITTMWRPVGG